MPYRIIVADPSPSVQRVAHLVFAEPEFRIFPFEDGPSLLEAVEDIRPDAVLVSLSLPGRGGAEIGRILRSRAGLGTVPIVGLKGTFESPEPDGVEVSDYDEIVQKPFDSERLAASVRGLIARKTGPATLPEEPLRPGPDAAPPPSVETGEASVAGPRDQACGSSPEAGLREWVRSEIVGMEREVEKRVRAGILAELREWWSRQKVGPQGRE